MRNRNNVLRQELQQAGAEDSEIPRLAELANRLKPKTSYRPAWKLALAALSGLLISSILLAYAQTSRPGNWTYPLKRLSENTAVAIDPAYRATLMMRRSEEVQSLVKHHAGSGPILATLAAYRSQAAAYNSRNYAAFEYCRNNLAQAAAAAPPAEQAAIRETLASLQT